MDLRSNLLVALALLFPVVGAAAQSIPNERLLNKDIAVYRRSPTELWVYDTRTEVGVGSHQMDQRTLDMIRALNIRLVRHTMYWNLVEPTEAAGRYDAKELTRWDDIIARCGRCGIVPLIVVHGNPPGVNYARRVESYARFAKFMADMAARYPTVRFWELWNEMDQGFTDIFGANHNDTSLVQRGKMYAEMLKLAYPAIKKANPKAWVLTGGMTDWDQFPRGIYEGGGRDYFDIMNLHTYGVPVLYGFVGRGLSLYSVMKEFHDEGRPLWNTEFGIDAGNVVNAWGIPHTRTPPEDDAKSFDEVHLTTWRECIEDSQKRRLFTKIFGYQFAAGNETAKDRVQKEARFPAGMTQDDFGFGMLRADGKTPRPTYDWLKKLDYNAPLLKDDGRTVNVEIFVTDGMVPVGYKYEYEWRQPWVLIKDVKISSLEPTVIKLQPWKKP